VVVTLVFVVVRFRCFAAWFVQLDYRGKFLVEVLFGFVLLGFFVVLRERCSVQLFLETHSSLQISSAAFLTR